MVPKSVLPQKSSYKILVGLDHINVRHLKLFLEIHVPGGEYVYFTLRWRFLDHNGTIFFCLRYGLPPIFQTNSNHFSKYYVHKLAKSNILKNPCNMSYAPFYLQQIKVKMYKYNNLKSWFSIKNVRSKCSSSLNF